jgi:hypothetical protein
MAQPMMTDPASAAAAMGAKIFIFECLIAIGTASTKSRQIRSARESFCAPLFGGTRV